MSRQQAASGAYLTVLDLAHTHDAKLLQLCIHDMYMTYISCHVCILRFTRNPVAIISIVKNGYGTIEVRAKTGKPESNK